MNDQSDLFNLDFSRWEVIMLCLVPAMINLGIYFYSSLAFQRNKTNNYFSLFVLLLGIWQMAEGFVRMSRTATAAHQWHMISSIFVVFVTALGIKFVLSFTKWNKKISRNIRSMLFFLPPIIFFILIETGFEKFSIVGSKNWYWIANPEISFVTIVMFIWSGTCALLMVFMLWLFFVKSQKNTIERKLAFLFASGFTIPIIIGLTVEAILPLVLSYDDIPVTVSLMTCFSVTVLIAIKKYKLLDFSPKHQWEQIIKSMNEGILITDNDDRIMYANNTYCDILGYSLSEMKGKIANELFLEPEQRAQIQDFIHERKNKKSGQYELQMKKKSGEKIWMMISGSPYLDINGNVIGSIGVQTDVTHLKETLKKIEYSESRLNEAQNVAHIGSWELNFATNRAIWSDEACRIYGIPLNDKDGLTYESWISHIHPDDLLNVQKEIQKSRVLFSTSSYQHRIVLKDGTIKHIHSVIKFEFNNQGIPIGLLGICHDITEQKLTEKALAENEIRMSTFISESLLCIFFVDPLTKKLIYTNSAFTNILGYTQEETKSLTVYDFIDRSKESIDARMDNVIGQRKIPNEEGQWKRKDGRIIQVLVSSFSQRVNDTDIIYVAAQDISERKKAEENMLATNKELETFIYKASHDLRAPLASIMGLVNVSKMELKDAASAKYLKMIDSLVQKLDYTLLELVKAMNIKNVEQFNDKIIFKELVSDVLNKFEYFKGYSRLQTSVDISFYNPFFANKPIIETILQNLVENAIKYQNYNIDNPFLKISITEDPKGVKITVEDNGAGMDKAIQSHVFDMYFRGTQSSNGSGLGLYLVKKGVDKLKGEMKLDSAPGRGTTFTIILKQAA